MAIKRGPDGIPVDTPSIKITESEPPTVSNPSNADDSLSISVNFDDQPTQKSTATPPNQEPVGTPPPGGQSLFLDDAPTVPARAMNTSPEPSEPSAAPKPLLDDQATVIHRASPPDATNDQTTPRHDPMSDPVSGWLVVAHGPGKGNFLKLGYGQNSIGRDPEQRVSLNFGDTQISRTNHATVTYDPRSNQFYLQPGTGTNLTYLNQEPMPVLQPMPLPEYSEITLGDTKLLFVPLCSEHFTWDQPKES
jgi:hypothetical protein